MLKLIFLLFPFYLFGASHTISCIGKVSGYTNLLTSFNFVRSAIPHDITKYDEQEPMTPYYFIDNSSVACGGNDPFIRKYVNSFENGEIIDSIVAVKDFQDARLITKKFEGTVFNNVILVDGFPCLPSSISTFYSYVNIATPYPGGLSEAPYAFSMSAPYLLDTTEALSSDDAKAMKNLCGGDSNGVDYTSYLDAIIDNTSFLSGIPNLISSVTDFFSGEKSKDNSLNKVASDLKKETNGTIIIDSVDGFNKSLSSIGKEAFEDNLETIKTNGCNPPAPIIFSYRGKSYEIFDITNLGGSNIDIIRKIFLFAGYLGGLIVVFRTI